jgi:hypothetical protein
VATIDDPSGTVGSIAQAGDGIADLASVSGDYSQADAGLGSFDLAAIFADDFHATATQGSFLIDILPWPWTFPGNRQHCSDLGDAASDHRWPDCYDLP